MTDEPVAHIESGHGVNGPRHLAIVGPTASGKTALAVRIARELGDVELVSVDAMAVYRGLDVGTAKPTPSERDGLCWHLLDLVGPDREFSVSEFQGAAREALAGIEDRGHTAMLVGGTGLYHRALLDDLALPPRYPDLAAALEREADATGPEALYERLLALDPVAASRTEPGNTRRIVRALEVTMGSGVAFSASGPGLAVYGPTRFFQLGLRLGRNELDQRIAERLDAQLARGFLDEVRSLVGRPAGLARTARQALGYRELLAHLEGETSLDEAVAETLRRTRTFARRQERWFGRDPRIVWFDAVQPDLVATVLAALARDT
ncbi:MAG: miaA [Acidimicrobiaceae bacterium]|nr:miaA [Acidimicrobiaceae bacterium]